ncbi:MAG: tRNA preQ1(34) S-adenosylmethionine ribosyltransferase-isomerase QueA [Thiotrichaceae bacterium]|nr:tRNA preQ1(34) S-adenosylmethionine ribosyltransferase-isomerase QueA [Thiotrichaceae bacterium]
MQRTDYSFNLPEHLIAQHPSDSRSGSRLLYMGAHSSQFQDLHFVDFPNLLVPGDLLVFNNTRVIPARLFGKKSSGGQVEVLVERVLDDNHVLAQLRSNHAPKPNTQLYFDSDITAIVVGRVDNFFQLQFDGARTVYDILQAIGHIPLPPYIKRMDTNIDLSRYQTVYAVQPGAVAAPTAGLHFDNPILEHIEAMGVEKAFITLHVGAGTFSPIRVDDISQHKMHSEYLQVSAEVCEQIKATRSRGGRVIAVGTTSVRALETASAEGVIKPYDGESRLFITPGYRFRSVDALLTNFHLPESTLLMLVCAFAGQSLMLSAYQHAIAQEYRFFSYGDAMFISKNCQCI